MSVRVLSPQESAQIAREKLQKAMRELAEAQVAVADAMSTLDSFEHNFRLGWYQVKDLPDPEEVSNKS